MKERIGFGKRLGAWVIDLIIIAAIGAVLGTVAGGAIGGLLGTGAASEMEGATSESAAAGAMLGSFIGGMAGMMAGVTLIGLLIFLIEGFTGFTPGKLALGIRVGSKDGNKAGLGALLVRFLVKNSALILSVLAGVTGVMVLSTIGSVAGLVVFIGCFLVLGQKRQAIHDMIGGTAVYKKSSL